MSKINCVNHKLVHSESNGLAGMVVTAHKYLWCSSNGLLDSPTQHSAPTLLSCRYRILTHYLCQQKSMST